MMIATVTDYAMPLIEIERMAREKGMPEWQIKQIIGNLVAPPAGSTAIDPEAAKDPDATGSDDGSDPVE